MGKRIIFGCKTDRLHKAIILYWLGESKKRLEVNKGKKRVRIKFSNKHRLMLSTYEKNRVQDSKLLKIPCTGNRLPTSLAQRYLQPFSVLSSLNPCHRFWCQAEHWQMDLLSLAFAIYLQSTLFIFSFNCCYNCSTVSRFLFAIIHIIYPIYFEKIQIILKLARKPTMKL